LDGQPTHDHELWESKVAAAQERAARQQERMIDDYGLRGDVQYHWSMDDATIVWSRDGREFLRGRITMLGSVDHDEQTWLWSWANGYLPEAVLGDIAEVRRYGEERAFPLLVWPSFRADQQPVRQARAVAADLLAAEGLWYQPGDDLDVHFALHDLRPA
jgi:hypothetical protein